MSIHTGKDPFRAQSWYHLLSKAGRPRVSSAQIKEFLHPEVWGVPKRENQSMVLCVSDWHQSVIELEGGPGNLAWEEGKHLLKCFQWTGVCKNSYIHTLDQIGNFFPRDIFQERTMTMWLCDSLSGCRRHRLGTDVLSTPMLGEQLPLETPERGKQWGGKGLMCSHQAGNWEGVQLRNACLKIMVLTFRLTSNASQWVPVLFDISGSIKQDRWH